MGHKLVMTKITMGKRKRMLLTTILMIVMLKLALKMLSQRQKKKLH